jgi:hypothetical protein
MKCSKCGGIDHPNPCPESWRAVVAAPKSIPAGENSLHRLVGRSLPSHRHGAWIVDEVHGERARLISANLRWDQWVRVTDLVHWLKLIENEASPNNQAQARDE